MITDKKNVIAWTLCVVLGLVFLAAAIAKFPYVPYLEKDIASALGARVENHRLIVAILARCLIAFELALGIALLQPNWRKRILLPLCLVTLVSFSIYLATLDPHLANCGCFGNWPPMTPLQSLFKNATLALIAIAALILSPKDPKGTVLVPILSVVTAVGLTFAIIPPTNYVTSSQGMDLTGLGTFHNQNTPADKGLALICFLNSTCEHCEEAAMDLQDFHLKYQMPVFFVLHGTESEIKRFFELTGTEEMPWQIVPIRTFLSATGEAPPRYHLARDGISITYWDGKFNAKAVVAAVKKAVKGETP